MREQQAHYVDSSASASPSLVMSLLSQGNNGSFNKPFAFKHGLYAAVLLNELIYLQDLFVHKKNKSMSALDGNTIVTGFFRSYKDLNRSTQIPLSALKRKGSSNNPIIILKKLGILATASTTIGESFKRVIVYSINEQEVHNKVLEATIDFYDSIEKDRRDQIQNTSVMTVSSQKGPISESDTEPNFLSCQNNTTVENKGLEAQNTVNSAKTDRYTQKDQLEDPVVKSIAKRVKTGTKSIDKRDESAASPVNSTVVSKRHPSNNILTPVTNLSGDLTSGTNLAGKDGLRGPLEEDEEEYSQEVIEALYSNNRLLNSSIVSNILSDLILNEVDIEVTYEELRDVAGLPSNYVASTRDLQYLQKIKDNDASLHYVDTFADRIIRNSVLIECGKRKRAFGQLFVGINI